MRAKIAKLIYVDGLLLLYRHDDIADTVRNMLEGFAAWAFTNPLGITITGTVLAAAIVAIAARASKGFRTVLGQIWRRLRRLRVTTEPRPSLLPLPPARWFLRPSREEGSWVLFNHGAGTALAVQLDPADGSSMVMGPGFWKAVPGQHAVGVTLRLGGEGWNDESSFRVTWRDERKIAWNVHLDAFPRDRYTGTEKVPPVPQGAVVPVNGKE